MKLLLYCTKAKPYLQVNRCVLPTEYDRYILSKEQYYSTFGEPLDRLNGKIVAECEFEVEEIRLIETPEYAGSECNTFLYDVSTNFETKTLTEDKLCKQSCLKASELDKYLDLFKDREIYGYAIHIKNLNIFDKLRELDDCEKYPKPIFDFTNNYYDDNYYELSHITKAPQNMCKVKLDNKPYILISIRPEWLCKILNGEKTIEVRKKVLKEMK